jgi:hypothetical protein
MPGTALSSTLRLADTLCGTKVLLRKDYEVLARERDFSKISIRSAIST